MKLNLLNPESNPMSLCDAQQDMRNAYYSGAIGMLVSAAAWYIAAAVSVLMSVQNAIWALFIGGMLIHPIAVLLTKALGRLGNHSPNNPLGALAIASTFWLIFSLPLAYVVSLHRIELFFPAMMLIIGGRYLTFASLFGTRIYWLCGMALAISAYVLVSQHATPIIGALTGAVIETVFGVIIFVSARQR